MFLNLKLQMADLPKSASLNSILDLDFDEF